MTEQVAELNESPSSCYFAASICIDFEWTLGLKRTAGPTLDVFKEFRTPFSLPLCLEFYPPSFLSFPCFNSPQPKKKKKVKNWQKCKIDQGVYGTPAVRSKILPWDGSRIIQKEKTYWILEPNHFFLHAIQAVDSCFQSEKQHVSDLQNFFYLFTNELNLSLELR